MIRVQPNQYGKAGYVSFQVFEQGVGLVIQENTVVNIPVTAQNGVYTFEVDTEEFTKISVSTNGSPVVTLQDLDPVFQTPVGPSFQVGFSNGLSSNAYVTQTHFVQVQIQASKGTIVNLFFS